MEQKPIITIYVTTYDAQILEGEDASVIMIPFRGEAVGEYFTGHTICNGVDTQIKKKDGSFSLSARYMMEGTDRSGNTCRLFIENNGTSLNDCKPKIYTDSAELYFLEKSELSAVIDCVENGVIIRIYETKPKFSKQ